MVVLLPDCFGAFRLAIIYVQIPTGYHVRVDWQTYIFARREWRSLAGRRAHAQYVYSNTHTHTHTHTRLTAFFRDYPVGRYQKGKTNLDFTEARDSEWQWHQLGHMQVCTSLQTDNHASTPPLSFLQAGCPSCHPTNSVKAQKAQVRVLS